VTRRRALIAGAALAALIVVSLLWWPSALLALQGLHGPLGGGPGMHGLR
jgi:hypothetical protein